MKKILLILDYFGRWPEWIDVFLLSCAHNPSINWLIHTDCPMPAVQPDNVRFVHMSFDDYCRLASDRLNLQFSPYWRDDGQPPRPIYTNLCDLRPCYGDLHAEALIGYDYFGWCDIDVVFGNLRRFLTPDVLEKNVITFSGEMCSGHFTLLKNEAHVVRMYQDIPQWRSRIEGRQGYTHWEDCLDEAWLSRLCSPPSSHFRSEALALGVPSEHIDRYRQNNAFVREWVTPFVPWRWADDSRLHPEVWYWSKGELSNCRDGSRTFPYLHFMNFKEHRYVDEPIYGLQSTWEGRSYLGQDLLQSDVIRIDREGFHGLTHDRAAADQKQLLDQMKLARQLATEGLSAPQALELLRPAGVTLGHGCLTDRAGVLSATHRESLWQEHRSSHA
jgi:hypothetical protein